MANRVKPGKAGDWLGRAASPPKVRKEELSSAATRSPTGGKLPPPALGRSEAKKFIEKQVELGKFSADVLQDIDRPAHFLEPEISRVGDAWEFRNIALHSKTEQAAPALVSSFGSMGWKNPPTSMRNRALDKVQLEVTAKRGQNILLLDVRLTDAGGRVCMLRRDDSTRLIKDHKKGNPNLVQEAVKADRKWLSLARPEQWKGTRLAGQQRDSQVEMLVARLNEVALASFAQSYVEFVESTPSLMLAIIKAGYGKADPDDDHPFETDKSRLTARLLERHADGQISNDALENLPAQVLGDCFRRLLHSWNGQLLNADRALLVALEAGELQGQHLEQLGNLINGLPVEKRDLLGVVLKSLQQFGDELGDVCTRLAPALMPGFEIWSRTPARIMGFMITNVDKLFPALPSMEQLKRDLESSPVRFDPPDAIKQLLMQAADEGARRD
jgi:hypothetical protein